MPSPRRNSSSRRLKTWGRGRAVRLPDYDYAGPEVVHLTICAARGDPFGDPSLAACVCSSVEFYTRELVYQLFGFCLMPDHLHVLLSPGESGVPVGRWLMAFKNYTGRAYANTGRKPPLWQRSAHDHVCRESETAETVLAYIVENPVRRGLVRNWSDWPWTRVFITL